MSSILVILINCCYGQVSSILVILINCCLGSSEQYFSYID